MQLEDPIITLAKQALPPQHHGTFDAFWAIGLAARAQLGRLRRFAAAVYLLGPNRHDPEHPPMWDPVAVRHALDTVDAIDATLTAHETERQDESIRQAMRRRAAALRQELQSLDAAIQDTPQGD